MEKILEILEKYHINYDDSFDLAAELSSLMSADLRKELIEFLKQLDEDVYYSDETAYVIIDEYLASRPDSRADEK